MVGGSFRVSSGQGKNYKALRITPYLSKGPGPRLPMLEVETDASAATLVMAPNTVLYHAK
ncbi:hypothetical protein BEN47_16765 [Hymenobacter lapidarius]|uniref:Uncharacterized protein n=1 Tax=Hymenobacter lapidarius TaxID=1908237 RepID=A0A1G1SZS0_9BACT|nr:hypothetical protein BEN47_16765 [Hymenobacter lapidarius]